MSTTLDQAHADLAAARQRITEWDRALADAETARDRIEDTAPDDPSVIDGFADEYARAEGRVRAAARGRRQAETAVLPALEGIVRAELDQARAAAKNTEQALAAHRRKLDALLAKVNDLDGADYRPVTVDDVPRDPGETVTVKTSRAAALHTAHAHAVAMVESIEYALHHGQARPYLSSQVTVDLPASVHEYLEARTTAGVPSPADAERATAIELDRLNAARTAEQQAARPRGWRTRALLPGRQSTGVLPG